MGRRIDITTKMGCIVNCRYCPQKLALSRYFKDDKNRVSLMSFEKFREYMDKLPSDVGVIFSGMCEPWLNPECTEMVEYAVASGREVDVYSTLVNMKQDDLDRLQKLKIHNFVLHVADKAENAKIPVTGEYKAMLAQVVRAHKDKVFPITTISVHGEFHPEIADIMKDAADVPVLAEMYDRAGNLEEDEGISITVSEKKKGRLACTKCDGDALDNNYLMPDGTVLLCPMDWGMDHVLGNLGTQSYEEISEGAVKQELRRRLSDENAGELLCRNCHASCPRAEYDREQFKLKLKQSIKKLIGRA